MKKVLILVFLISLVAPVFANTNNTIAILYNGKSPVNRETAKYIIKQSSKVGLDFKFKVMEVDDIDNISEYKSVIILNTGIQSDQIDQTLKSFIDRSTDKTNFILLSFIKGQSNFDAKLLTGSNALGGVDGISSASIYKGGQNNDYEWFDMLVELLK